MHKQLIEHPIIFAICGKSASGKDTLAKWLSNYFSSFGLYVHNMTSCTTRPPREGEKDGEAYYFLNNTQFDKLIKERKLIEYTHFRGWKYGIPFDEVKNGYINIGVFNLEGLNSLTHSKYNYTIIPIYLEEKLLLRLRRSKDREGKWRLEFFRRAFRDWRDFKNVKKYLNKFHGRYIYLKDTNGVWKQSNQILHYLTKWKIIIQDKDKWRLGNFI